MRPSVAVCLPGAPAATATTTCGVGCGSGSQQKIMHITYYGMLYPQWPKAKEKIKRRERKREKSITIIIILQFGRAEWKRGSLTGRGRRYRH